MLYFRRTDRQSETMFIYFVFFLPSFKNNFLGFSSQWVEGNFFGMVDILNDEIASITMKNILSSYCTGVKRVLKEKSCGGLKTEG